jgi:cation-transporting P-type ATPase E
LSSTTTSQSLPEPAAGITGLASAEVAARVREGQVNDVPLAPTRTVGEILRANILTPFNALLGGLLAVILVVGPLKDALFGVVLIANALVGIIQELRAKRSLDRLALLSTPKATILRNGEVAVHDVTEVVLDDVLKLGSGDQVVVDGIVLRSGGLELDESLLTGEAEPVRKLEGDEVLSGSFVVAGNGVYQATRVGAKAYASALA